MKTKIVLGCGVLLVVPVLAVMITVAVFLDSLEFGEMEPMRVVELSGHTPGADGDASRFRVAAEWEPALGALVAWPLVVPESLVVEIAKDDTLFLLVDDEEAQSEARDALVKLGVDLDSVQFIVAAPGHARPWPRDWGPPARFSQDGEYGLVDPTFDDYPFSWAECDSRLLYQKHWFLKPLDEERILVARPPEGHSHSEHAEAIVRELETLTNVHGRPYEILRIDTPPYWRDFMPAYTNSLILNRKVLVPLFGIPADQQALETWRRAMPGYQVIGFEHITDGWEGWMWFDALHCRVRAVWDPEMLYMSHRRVDPVSAPVEAYPVEVRILDYSDAGLVLEMLELRWRLHGEDDWRVIRLESTADPEMFSASIPGAADGKTVECFLSAADNSGRRESLPRTAPDGFFSISVLPGDDPG
jgi:hypothetical protein